MESAKIILRRSLNDENRKIPLKVLKKKKVMKLKMINTAKKTTISSMDESKVLKL